MTIGKATSTGLTDFGNFYVKLIAGTCFVDDLKDFLKKTNAIALETGVSAQGFNAEKLAGRRHILYAARRASEAFETGRNSAKDRGLEIMRFASGQRQIEKAFQMGLSEGNMKCLFVLSGENPEKFKDAEAKLSEVIDIMDFDDVVRPSENRKALSELFGITDDELEAVSFGSEGKPLVSDELFEDLVIERTALVDYTK